MSAFKIAVIAIFCFSLQVVDGQDDFGVSHSCAVSCSDNVICWGDNRFGQLGSDDNTTTMNHVNISNVIQISTGAGHTCVLKNDSTVVCWGNNIYGQLGNSQNSGTENPNSIPLDVNITDVKQISAGFGHTCALKNDGTVACWGWNVFGQLGDEKNNGTENPNFTPLDVNITEVKQISAGQGHTCVLKNDGTVACWGYNGFGQLGNSHNIETTNPNSIPLIVNIADVKQISVGYAHTCALKTDSTIWCWGLKFAFGNGQNLNYSDPNFYTNIPEKMEITQKGNIVQFTAGLTSTCILYDTRKVYCTGLYDFKNPNRTFSIQPDKSILSYKTATDVAFLAERNDENICSNTKDDDPKLSVPAIVGIVLGSVILCGGILYFILKGSIGEKTLGIGRYVQLKA